MAKIVKIILIVFVIWYIVTFPTEAGAFIRGGLSALESAARSGASFISSL